VKGQEGVIAKLERLLAAAAAKGKELDRWRAAAQAREAELQQLW
jgi:hypothetical protein